MDEKSTAILLIAVGLAFGLAGLAVGLGLLS